MELKTTKAQLAQYFSAWLNSWITRNEYTQLQGAIRLEVTPGFVNMIINNKRAASAGQMEKIAKSAGLDLLDILLEGRQLLEPAERSQPAFSRGGEEWLSLAGLSGEQAEVLGKYRDLLLIGGEGVEVISESIRGLAKKKNIGEADKNRPVMGRKTVKPS